MPLSFQMADRETGGPVIPTEPDDVLTPQDLSRWRRPYQPGPWRVVGAALLLLVASYMLFSTLIIAMAGTMTAAALCGCLAAAVIAVALRLLRIGIWVSRHGLRQVSMFSTRTLRWSEVASVRTAQQPVRWLGLPRTVQGQALLITRRRGDVLRVLLTDHNADFLSRPKSFDRAADTVEAWAAEHC